MAFHLPFSYKRRYLPASELQSDFAGGMIRDLPPHLIPRNAAYYLRDFLIDQPGKLVRRGPFSAMNTNTPAWGANVVLQAYPAYYPLTTSAPDITFVTSTANNHLYYTRGGTTSVDIGASKWFGSNVKGSFVFYLDKLFAAAAGNAPKQITWNGTTATVAAMGGSPPQVAFFTLYKNRIVGGGSTSSTNANRLYFSPAPDPTTTWDTTNSWIDCEHQITGLVGLKNVLLIFSKNAVERIIGDTPPPGSNMDRTTLANIGLGEAVGPQAITVWNDNAIWANDYGVFMSNGTTPVDLTLKGGISNYYREQLADADSLGSVGLTLGVYRNFLIISGFQADPATAGLMVYDLERNVWFSIGGGGMTFNSLWGNTVSGVDELVGADSLSQQLVNFSSVFAPDPLVYAEMTYSGRTVTIDPVLQTRAYTGANLFGRKRFNHVTLDYALNDPSTLDPTLTIQMYAGIGVGPISVKSTTVAESNTSLSSTRQRAAMGFESDGAQFTVSLTTGDTASTLNIYGIEVNAASLPDYFEGLGL